MRRKQFRKMAAIMAAAMMVSSANVTAFASAPENEETAQDTFGEKTGGDQETSRVTGVEESEAVQAGDSSGTDETEDTLSEDEADHESVTFHTEEEQAKAKEDILAYLEKEDFDFETFLEKFLLPRDMYSIMGQFSDEDWAKVFEKLDDKEILAWSEILPYVMFQHVSYVESEFKTEAEISTRLDTAITDLARVEYQAGKSAADLDEEAQKSADALAFTYMEQMMDAGKTEATDMASYKEAVTGADENVKNKLEVLSSMVFDEKGALTQESFDTIATMLYSSVGIVYESPSLPKEDPEDDTAEETEDGPTTSV